MKFVDRYERLVREKNTVLCVGIDPALPRQRNTYTIPQKYVYGNDENKARLDFCLDIVDTVKDNAIAIKPNQQYVFGFTKMEHRRLTDLIRKRNMLSILDYKLNDISDTVASAIFHLSEAGYDAVTFNPLAGNLEETIKLAHDSVTAMRGYDLGILVLTLMSNPEAVTFMKKPMVGRVPMFALIAQQVKDFEADGCVVGATGHVTAMDIRKIRTIVGPDKIFLVPGVGTQKGDIRKVLTAAGENIIVNVGRDIIYSEDPRDRSREYSAKLAIH